MKLTFRQKLSYFNHMFKVLTRNHHTNLSDTFSNYINQNSIIFDVGGHAGQFTKLFSNIASKGKVFSFEPSEYSRSILQAMVGLKFLNNVFIMPFGLSNHPQTAEIHTPIKKQGSLGYGLAFVGSTDNYEREMLSTEIILSTIDSVVESLAIEKLDFIKADIEGSELLMLKGGEQTLKKFKPTLYLEVNDQVLARNNNTGVELYNFLKDLGYKRTYKITESNEVCIEEIPINEQNFNGDYLFVYND